MEIKFRYQVILADPPWWYNNRKTGGERKNKTKFGGGARKHYSLMRDQELRDMKPFIDSLADENCALFMWATMPRLDFAIELLKHWEFRYATVAFTWVKTKIHGDYFIYGPGYYTASNAEVVLLGIKGRMAPSKKMSPSVISCPRTRHSEKPRLHDRISKMYPTARRIELFARERVNGWDAWGDEIIDGNQVQIHHT